MPKPEALVRLYPLPGASIPGVPAVEQDVTAERAAGLLAYTPPAFTTDPPKPEGAPQVAPSNPTED